VFMLFRHLSEGDKGQSCSKSVTVTMVLEVGWRVRKKTIRELRMVGWLSDWLVIWLVIWLVGNLSDQEPSEPAFSRRMA
jgi:hypothetical protein